MDAISIPEIALQKVSLPNIALLGHVDNAELTYISDGLAFHLDGINKGGVEGKWTDLVGGVEFTPTEDGVVWGENFVNGNLESERIISVLNGTGTVEIAYQATIASKAGYALFYSGQPVKGFAIGQTLNYYWLNGIYLSGGYGAKLSTLLYKYCDPYIVSSNRLLTLCNGRTYNSVPMNGWNFTSSKAKIFRSEGFCNIYSIRIYDRLLTESEMRHNQEVDKKRFGLTIIEPVMTLDETYNDETEAVGMGADPE